MKEFEPDYPVLRVQTNLEKPSGHIMTSPKVRTKEFFCIFQGTLFALVEFKEKRIDGMGLRRVLRALTNCKLPEIIDQTYETLDRAIRDCDRQIIVVVSGNENTERRSIIPMTGNIMVS